MKTKTERLLIIVDMINGFVRKGALSDRGIEAIIPDIVRRTERALERGDKVVAFRDCHQEGCVEFKNFPPHCLEHSEESELIDELLPFEEHMTVIRKNSTCGMVVPAFVSLLETLEDLREVVIVGCCTDICVLGLALPLKSHFNEMGRDVEVVVPQNEVETFDLPGHPRGEYNKMSFALLKQAGILIPETSEEA